MYLCGFNSWLSTCLIKYKLENVYIPLATTRMILKEQCFSILLLNILSSMREEGLMSDHAARWSARLWPFLLGFGGGLLLPWAFILQLIYGHSLMALILLSLVSSVLFVALIGWLAPATYKHSELSTQWSYRSTIILVALQSCIGAVIFSVYWYMRAGLSEWPPLGAPDISSPVISVMILFASSITAALAGKENRRGNLNGFINLYLVTALLWIAYSIIIIVSWIELSSAGHAIDTSFFTISYYCISGVHFAHLLFGLILLGLSIVFSFRQGLKPDSVRSMLVYIHFVNAFGIWGLPQLFL